MNKEEFENMINTIQLGNCYVFLKDIPAQSIDCIYVDVPYLYNSGIAGSREIAKRTAKNKMELHGVDSKKYKNQLTPSENLRIAMNKKKANQDIISISDGFDYKTFIKEAFRIMKKPNIFIWCSPMQILDIMNELSFYSASTPTILVWCKSNPIPTTNNNWLSDVEYCIYLREGIKLNDGYELKSKYYVSPINKSDKDLYKHPTIKPLNLVKRHLLHTTSENDIVLDCFCGSGTTCQACKEINRRYIGIELKPRWYKVAIDRLNGIDASGQTSIFTDFDNIN